MLTTFKRHLDARVIAGTATVAAVILSLAACGSGAEDANDDSAGDSSQLVGEAAAAVEKSTKPLPGQVDGSPIDVTSLSGKSVAFVAISGSDFGKTVAEGMKEAGAEVGITVLPYFGDGTLDTARTQIANAVTKGVDGIVLASWDPAALRDSLESAADRGVKIVGLGQYDYDQDLPQAAKDAGMVASVGTCYRCMGELMADALAADSDGDAHALFLNVPEIGAASLVKAGFDAELERVCPDCETTTVDSSAASLQTQMPQAVSSALVKDPDLNYVIPVFDVYAPFFTPAISSSGAGDRVQLLGADASRGPLLDMQKGTTPTWLYNAGYNTVEAGWASVDQLMRVMLGEQPAKDTFVPNRGFTAEVVDGMDPDAFPDAWFGSDADYYKRAYLEIWQH